MTEPQRLGPPPVEPMNDLAWSRIERGLWARLDEAAPITAEPERPRRWWLVAAPALAAAAVIAIVIGTRGDAVSIDEMPARVVSDASPSAISFGDAHVTLDPHTAVVMNHDPNTPSALVEYGSAWFAVAPRHDRAPFVVHAGDVTVRVVGTRFLVARSAEVVTVEVDRGTIEIQFHETRLELNAGQRWSSQPTQTAAIAPEPAAPPAAIEPPPSTTTLDNKQPAKPVAKPRITKPAPTKPDVAKADLAPPPPPVVVVDPDRATFDGLAHLELRDPAGAIAGYLQLSNRSPKWAAQALYAAGRLAAERRDPRARDLLASYLRRFPRGRNADDVREVLAHLKGATP